MTLSLQVILEGKRKLRRELSAKPVAEKLLILDAMKERDATIRGAHRHPTVDTIERAVERRRS